MASKRRKKEEKFTILSDSQAKHERDRVNKRADKRVKKRKSGAMKKWDKLTEGPVGALVYIFLGIGLALVARQVLAVTLSTEMPVVAVVTASMQHNDAEITHYHWLATNLGYNESYINSWPVSGGFLIGDMPIVKGEESYEVGDVIVYSVSGEKFPIIHRIVKVNEDGSYQTKGDNNPDQLPYEFKVTDNQIHGKVVLVIPKLGYFKVIVTKLMGVV